MLVNMLKVNKSKLNGSSAAHTTISCRKMMKNMLNIKSTFLI